MKFVLDLIFNDFGLHYGLDFGVDCYILGLMFASKFWIWFLMATSCKQLYNQRTDNECKFALDGNRDCDWQDVFNDFYVPYVHYLHSRRQENQLFPVKLWPKNFKYPKFEKWKSSYHPHTETSFTKKSWFSCLLEREQCTYGT